MPQKNSLNAKSVLRVYWSEVSKYKLRLLGIGIALPTTVIFSQYLPPLVLAHALERVSNNDYIQGQFLQSFGHEIFIYALLVFTSSFLLWRLLDILMWGLEMRVLKNLADRVFTHLISLSSNFFADNFSGSLVSQTNKLLGSYVRIADTTIYGTMQLVIGLIATAVILFPKSPLFVVCLIGFAIAYVLIAIKASKGVREAGRRHAHAESEQTGYLADALTNIIAIKSFSSDQHEIKRFKTATTHTKNTLRNVAVEQQKQVSVFSVATGTINVASFVIATFSVVVFNANVALVFLIFNYTANIISQLFSFSNSALRNYNRSIGDASDMVHKLSLAPEIKDPDNPEELVITRGKIEFNNVTFRHNGANESIFSKLNLAIKPGEKVGLVGHSGSGKTSLTKILLRFSDIENGVITIDGQNIAHITQNDLRSVISYVPQEPLLFHRSLKENIAYGKPNAQEREIIAVAKQAHAHDFIAGLPDGYNTLVGERGVKLSGGQRQRIAIARAMLKNAPILVLDEATSALDSESEALIQDALWKLMEGRTAIVIAHRLSTIQKMDRIIVLDNGKIIEQGSHRELIRKGGKYAELWNRQSGGFIDT